MFVKTIELAAVTAVHSVDPDRWWTEYSAMIDRIVHHAEVLNLTGSSYRLRNKTRTQLQAQ